MRDNGGSSYSLVAIFALAFFTSMLSGIAAFLRSKQPATPIAIITAGMNSGFLGLGISLSFYSKFKDNITVLLGFCVLTGLSGASGLDFILTTFQKGGIKISLGGDGGKKDDYSIGVGQNDMTKSPPNK
jgi:hypothetical protein